MVDRVKCNIDVSFSSLDNRVYKCICITNEIGALCYLRHNGFRLSVKCMLVKHLVYVRHFFEFTRYIWS